MVGLDPIHARIVKQELKERSRAGMTVLMSTHLLNIAEEVADRIGIIKDGKLLIEGSLEELRNHAGAQGQSLEDVFLSLTAAPAMAAQ